MTIHFICRGNIFRSIMAEAYLKSLRLPNLEVSSSGTVADSHRESNRPYQPEIADLLRWRGLADYYKAVPEQLTPAKVNGQDLVVCLNQRVYDEAKRMVKLPAKTLIWQVDDIGEGQRQMANGNRRSLEEEAFHEIKMAVDQLVSQYNLAPTNSKGLPMENYELVDANDRLVDRTATFEEVIKQGLWHRGIHIIIYTAAGEIVMQKRASNLLFYPGQVEISVGGGVNAGESPETAAVREVKEELGIDISPYTIHFLGKSKYNHRFKRGFQRVIIYSYAVCVPEPALAFKPSLAETALVFMLSRPELETAIDQHRVPGIGNLVGVYAYWRWLLQAVPR